MIAGLKGTIEQRLGDSLLLLVGGVVYQVYVPASVLASAPNPGSPFHLHTHLHLKDDVMALYGFTESGELELFRALLTVSGVGPKLALAVLSGLGAERVIHAVQRQDTETLAGVPGVGKRIAGRIALELKGKLGAIGELVGTGAGADPFAQVVAALTSLGYSAAEAREASQVAAASSAADLAAAVRASLRYLAEKG